MNNPLIKYLNSIERSEIPEPDEVVYFTVESPNNEEILTVKGKIRNTMGEEILIY